MTLQKEINSMSNCNVLSHEESLIFITLLFMNLFIKYLITKKLKHECEKKFTIKCQNNKMIAHSTQARDSDTI